VKLVALWLPCEMSAPLERNCHYQNGSRLLRETFAPALKNELLLFSAPILALSNCDWSAVPMNTTSSIIDVSTHSLVLIIIIILQAKFSDSFPFLTKSCLGGTNKTIIKAYCLLAVGCDHQLLPPGVSVVRPSGSAGSEVTMVTCNYTGATWRVDCFNGHWLHPITDIHCEPISSSGMS
jgi:hypothetical protein